MFIQLIDNSDKNQRFVNSNEAQNVAYHKFDPLKIINIKIMQNSLTEIKPWQDFKETSDLPEK